MKAARQKKMTNMIALKLKATYKLLYLKIYSYTLQQHLFPMRNFDAIWQRHPDKSL